jgi:hypothetical protein
MTFVCHHNAYLVAGFLKQCGHNCRWISGYYQCNPPAPPVHHSWIDVIANSRRAAIFEFDPRQLFDRGGYYEDQMPSGEIPELGIRISPIAIIVSSELVELPDDPEDLRFVVTSQEVLGRYVQDHTLALDIDFNYLDELAEKSRVYYAEMLSDFIELEND